MLNWTIKVSCPHCGALAWQQQGIGPPPTYCAQPPGEGPQAVIICDQCRGSWTWMYCVDFMTGFKAYKERAASIGWTSRNQAWSEPNHA